MFHRPCRIGWLVPLLAVAFGCGAPSGVVDAGTAAPPDRDAGAADDDSGAPAESDAGSPSLDCGPCDSPASVCLAPTGRCEGGECVYAFQDGVECDDGNPSTLGDRCSAGTCAGSAAGPWVDVGVGRSHACALREDGAVYCWGSNFRGAVGDGTMIADRPTPVAAAIDSAEALAVGADHTCVLRTDATVWCWGVNTNGRLGDGTSYDRRAPVQVVDLTDVVSIAAGSHHTCAVDTDARVWCWGDNSVGQLALGFRGSERLRPTLVAEVSDVEQVEADGYTCARTRSGQVFCWGMNGDGQLGDGSGESAYEPVPVADLDDAIDVSVGTSHACAVRATGRVVCWGSDEHHQLGDGPTEGPQLAPAEVGVDGSRLEGALGVSTGFFHTCARRATDVWCWGWNNAGQLGVGGTEHSPIPLRVPDLPGSPGALRTGSQALNTCAVTTDGVFCWGDNYSRQIGDGMERDYADRPSRVLLP